MRVLLDTHVLLWYYLDDPQLTPLSVATIEDPSNSIVVSPASFWEIAIKLSTGKYSLQVPFLDFLQEAIFDNGFDVLPITFDHANVLAALPFHHRDPFDRMLVAQAQVESMPIVSVDRILDLYSVHRIG